MKQLFFKLKELIKRGILRIFPNWQGIPVRYALYALAMLTLFTVYGCAGTRPVTQLVRNVQRDTVYLSNVKYDSIYVYQERLQDRSKDTIYLKDVSVEYRYKLLRDTIRVVKRDSIPYEVTVIETKELQRPLTFYDHLTRLTFWLVIGALLSFIFIKIKRVF